MPIPKLKYINYIGDYLSICLKLFYGDKALTSLLSTRLFSQALSFFTIESSNSPYNLVNYCLWSFPNN